MEAENRVKQIYLSYQKNIVPMVGVLETDTGEFPIEILNEIRAIFTHLGDYTLYKDEKSVSDAESHLKRAIYDCYKYICMTYAEEIGQREDECQDVDLTTVSDGDFIKKFYQLKQTARDTFIEAKIMENVSEDTKKNDEAALEKIYSKYEDAYNAYCKLREYWYDNGVGIETAKNRFQKQEEERQREHLMAQKDRFIAKVSLWVTSVSLLFAIIGIVISIVH